MSTETLDHVLCSLHRCVTFPKRNLQSFSLHVYPWVCEEMKYFSFFACFSIARTELSGGYQHFMDFYFGVGILEYAWEALVPGKQSTLTTLQQL